MYKELENLLDPVSLDEVCGSNLEESDELYRLGLFAKGKSETQFSEAEPPDWKQIEKQSKKLFSKSKDLWVTYHLITGLFATKGFDGLTNGLEFMYELLSKYWNSVYPLIEEEDDDNIYAFRLNPIQTLFSPRGNLYGLISNTTITKSNFFKNHRLNEIVKSKSNNNKNNKVTDFLNAIKDTPDEEVEAIRNQFSQILTISNNIYKLITDKTGNEKNIIDKNAFDHLITVISSLISDDVLINENEKNGDSSEAESIDNTVKAKTQQKVVSLDNLQICGRTDIKKIFKAVCAWYDIHEPASPVPMLVKRAESLIGKRFIEIINDIANNSLEQIHTLFGVNLDDNPNNDSIESKVNSEN
jgi:type VI secretion system protein ImpA